MYSRQAPIYKLTCYSLAYGEMRLILATMLWHFDFELEDPRRGLVWELEGVHGLGKGTLKDSPEAR
jgi:hypothetical protein